MKFLDRIRFSSQKENDYDENANMIGEFTYLEYSCKKRIDNKLKAIRISGKMKEEVDDLDKSELKKSPFPFKDSVLITHENLNDEVIKISISPISNNNKLDEYDLCDTEMPIENFLSRFHMFKILNIADELSKTKRCDMYIDSIRAMRRLSDMEYDCMGENPHSRKCNIMFWDSERFGTVTEDKSKFTDYSYARKVSAITSIPGGWYPVYVLGGVGVSYSKIVNQDFTDMFVVDGIDTSMEDMYDPKTSQINDKYGNVLHIDSDVDNLNEFIGYLSNTIYRSMVGALDKDITINGNVVMPYPINIGINKIISFIIHNKELKRNSIKGKDGSDMSGGINHMMDRVRKIFLRSSNKTIHFIPI